MSPNMDSSVSSSPTNETSRKRFSGDVAMDKFVKITENGKKLSPFLSN